MADTLKTETRIALLAGFSDEDDRTINLSNPRDNVTEAEVRALEPYASTVLVGDKYGAPFTRFKSAKIITVTTIEYDLQT